MATVVPQAQLFQQYFSRLILLTDDVMNKKRDEIAVWLCKTITADINSLARMYKKIASET